jgi:hypothetical protein
MVLELQNYEFNTSKLIMNSKKYLKQYNNVSELIWPDRLNSKEQQELRQARNTHRLLCVTIIFY